MSHIELRHLATLAAVVDEGSFGRAAAKLGYTQSTVSQQIAALERAVGGAVFERPGGPRPVRLTPLGAVVLPQGRDLLAKAAALADTVERFKAGDGRIDIGTFHSVSNVILPAVVRRLRDEHPGCDIRLFEDEADQPRIAELDLLFYDGRVRQVRPRATSSTVKLLDDPYLLVAAAGTFPEGPVRSSGSTAIPMVAWPADLRPAPHRAGVRRQRRPAPDRVPHRRQRDPPVDGARRPGIGAPAVARPRRHHRLRPTNGSASTRCCRRSRRARSAVYWRAGRTHAPLAARAIQISCEVAETTTERLKRLE